MEDDGLILNFATVDDLNVQPLLVVKVSGGRWKERRNMKFKLQGRERRPPVSGVNNIDVPSSKMDGLREEAEKMMSKQFPVKKAPVRNPREPKMDPRREARKRDAEDGEKKHGMGISAKKVKFSESSGEKGGLNNSYVSSLFTSNKSSDLTESAEKEASHLPSNAPLKDASTFAGLGLTDRLATHLTSSMRYLAPTKVQRAVAPELLTTENDYFVKAQTGSGKTLAFVLPIVNRIMMEQNQITRLSGLFAMILTPTRELASQIYSVLESLLRCHHHIVPGIVVGGEKKKSEKARIRKGVNILVATPGRLADHFENTTSLDVSQMRWLVLDEGDRLVELGFQETISKITDHLTRNSKVMDSMHKWPGLPTRRVNVLCSATMPEDVKQFGNTLLRNPQMISVDGDISTNNSNATAPDQLVQKVMVVPPKLRLVTLCAVLKKISAAPRTQTTRTIVFFSCSDSVNFHFEVFARDGRAIRRKEREAPKIPRGPREETENKEKETQPEEPCVLTAPQLDAVVFRLHGSLSQQMRSSTLMQFVSDEGANKGKHLVLFCTDVASRGLDLPNIAHVVEYDAPFATDDHLHRIGRSARVGNEGEATLFLLPGEEESYVDGKLRIMHPKGLRVVNYENVLKSAFAEKDAAPTTSKGKKDPKAKDGKWDIHATTWHLEVERWLLEDSGALDRALHAFTSHIRAYTTHLLAERMYFNVKLLHLGHLAKSFGLRETPKKLGRVSGVDGSNMPAKTKEDPRKKMLRMARKAENATTSEFNY